jgi:DNA polymerase-3 subunit gamma/tau
MRNIRVLQESEDQAKWSKQSRIYLELAVIKMCKIEYDTSKEVLLSRINKMEEIIRQGKITVACETVVSKVPRDNKTSAKPVEAKIRPVEEFNAHSQLNLDAVKKSWKDILETFKARRHMVLYASLMTGRLVGCNKGIVEIQYEAQYAFNKQRLEKEDNKRTIEEIFSEVLKEKVKLKYIVEDNKSQEKSPEDMLIETFGKDLIEIIDE